MKMTANHTYLYMVLWGGY